MSALFPAPVRAYTTFSDALPSSTSDQGPLAAPIPHYPLRVKQQFVPRHPGDFGDGGAYPELHVAQFPLGMGKKGSVGSLPHDRTGTLALQVRGEDGRVSYDAIVTHQHRDKTKVYTRFSDMAEKESPAAALTFPSLEEEVETATRTRTALQTLVQGKVASSLPTHVGRQPSVQETAKYIRYTPNELGRADAPTQRIIRMVQVAKDPMEPPKFRHTKAVRGPPSPPVPVLHSPPRKLTVTDQQSWKIPPCISNWKNSKGFTIALDKRLAADGRGLQQVTVNDKFASLSEALAIAERKAREEVNLRAQVQKKLAIKQKEQKELELRQLASQARMERAGLRAKSDEDDGEGHRRPHASDYGDQSDDDGRVERDAMRRERKKEREREMRLEKMGKKGKLGRDQDRDMSEKIALGQLQGAGRAGKSDGLFDARLFNQSQGMSSGFGHDDEYTVYSKPLVDRGKASVYRPKGDDGALDADRAYQELHDGHQKRFKADKQFCGTEVVAQQGERTGPVQFAKAKKEDEGTKNKASVARPDRRSHSTSSQPKPQSPRDRSRSASNALPRSRPRSRHRSISSSRSTSRGRESPSPFRGRERSAPRGRTRRSPSRSLSHVQKRRRARAQSFRPSRGRRHRRRSSSSSASTLSRSRSRRKRRRRSPSRASADDPFGLDQFLTDARKGMSDHKRRRRH